MLTYGKGRRSVTRNSIDLYFVYIQLPTNSKQARCGFQKNPLTHPGSTLKTKPGRPRRRVMTSPTCVISKVNPRRTSKVEPTYSSIIASPRVGREHEQLFQF